jgi:hypothetical protein
VLNFSQAASRGFEALKRAIVAEEALAVQELAEAMLQGQA